MNPLEQRLREIAADLGEDSPPNTFFQKMLDLSSGRITQLFEDGANTRLGTKSLNRLVALGYNPDWVLHGGSRPKFLGNLAAEPEYTYDVSRPDRFLVPVFDVSASMGLGKARPEYESVIDGIRLTPEWVHRHLPSISSPGQLAVLSAYGDSMAPTFSDGDLLLVDRGITETRLDAVYVLALHEELYVKRVQRRITDGALIIKSDNQLYDPVIVENGERAGLEVLGRVVWAWNGRKL